MGRRVTPSRRNGACSVTLITVARTANNYKLGAGEQLVVAAKTRRITGPIVIPPPPKSFVASPVIHVRRLRPSKVIGLTRRRILIYSRAVWTGRPKEVLAEIPLSRVQGAAIAEHRPPTSTAVSIRGYKGRIGGGATIHLRSGDTLTAQVHSYIGEGLHHYYWNELADFVNQLNGQTAGQSNWRVEGPHDPSPPAEP
jgi:hypothetical protein